MFNFIYKGKFDCLITKVEFEMYVENLYNDMKKLFKISWNPKKFIVTMETDPTKEKGWGGNTNTDYDTNRDNIIYKLNLQLFGFSKSELTFSIIQKLFGYTLTHEMLHFFIPYVQHNSCWSEGVTDFMTFWYSDTINENLSRLAEEYKNITNKEYKQHKYGYFTGFKKMAKLYEEDSSVIKDMKRIIKDFNKSDISKKNTYFKKDIIKYNGKFSTFFTGNCNRHFEHKLE